MTDEDDYGTIGGMRIGRGNRSTLTKPDPWSLCPPQIPHDLIRAGTRAAAVGSRRLTAWAMARPKIVFSLNGNISEFPCNAEWRRGNTYCKCCFRSRLVFSAWQEVEVLDKSNTAHDAIFWWRLVSGFTWRCTSSHKRSKWELLKIVTFTRSPSIHKKTVCGVVCLVPHNWSPFLPHGHQRRCLSWHPLKIVNQLQQRELKPRYF
jgi:hypothetical protein